MAKKIPSDAFDVYFAQGSERSYQALATKYGVTKKAITLAAKRESWQRRILELEARAREASDKKKSETLEERNNRHLQEFRFLEAKAVKALREYPIKSAADAERALELAVQQQRIISGVRGIAHLICRSLFRIAAIILGLISFRRSSSPCRSLMRWMAFR